MIGYENDFIMNNIIHASILIGNKKKRQYRFDKKIHVNINQVRYVQTRLINLYMSNAIGYKSIQTLKMKITLMQIEVTIYLTKKIIIAFFTQIEIPYIWEKQTIKA